MGRPLRLLLIEDSAADAELVALELRRARYEITTDRVDNAEDLSAALETGPWDLVLLDYGLPGFSSAEALQMIRMKDAEVPVVILSGSIGDDAAIDALKAGASGVVAKSNLPRLPLVAERELADAETRRKHRAAELALQESEARKTAMFDGALDAILSVDPHACIVDLNPAAEAMFGQARAQLSGRPIAELVPLADLLQTGPERDRLTVGQGQEARHETRGTRVELMANRAGGIQFPAEVSVIHGRLSGRPFVTVFVRDLTEHRRAEEAAHAAEHSYRMLFESSPLAMLCYDADTLAILEVNDAAVGLYGHSIEEFLSLTMTDIVAQESASLWPSATATGGATRQFGTIRHVGKNGGDIDVLATSHEVVFGGRRAQFVVIEDVGERERLARQLRQSQRLESLGQLAGGVAHDFNNLLGVIINYATFIKEQLDESLAGNGTNGDSPGEAMRHDIEQVQLAAQRAVTLTRQLLLFSRREITQAAIVSVNDVATGLEELLRRTVGEHVQLAATLADDVWSVAIDPGQLEQVIVNLVVNSRDAMPDGGCLTIDTENILVDADFAATRPGISTGRYVRLRVSDTGKGMDEATVDRAFEPFFTTKPTGQGTGLGLATIYGIVTQAGGRVHIYSEPDHGTAVSVLLPAADDALKSEPRPSQQVRHPGGDETILLVEDEQALREVTTRMLERNGYHVLSAADGKQAMTLATTHVGRIELLLTDVIMPGALGREVAAKMVALRPAIRVLYISGYAHSVLGAQGTLDPGVELLEKPFTEPTLLTKVRQVLDAGN